MAHRSGGIEGAAEHVRGCVPAEGASGCLAGVRRMGEKKVDNLLEGIEQAKGRGWESAGGDGDAAHRGFDREGAGGSSRIWMHCWPRRSGNCGRRMRRTTSRARRRHGLPKDAGDLPETGLGKLTALAVVYAYLHSEVARKTFEELREAGVDLRSKDFVDPTKKAAGAEGPFAGKTMVLTGTLDSYEREDLKEVLEKAGAKVSGSVSSKTSNDRGARGAGASWTKRMSWGSRCGMKRGCWMS